MIRYAALTLILGLALLAAACGGGDSGPAPSPSPTGEAASSTATIDETPPTEASPSVDEVTPSAGEETPDIEETPGTTSSPTPVGTPAISSGNLQFDINSELVDCVFDAETSLTDCGDEGTFTIDQPLVGAYTECDLYMIGDQPVMLICSGEGNVGPAYFSIPQ